MKLTFVNLLFVLLAALIILTGCSSNVQKEEVLAVIDEFYNRYSGQDFEGLTEIMHPDLAGNALEKTDQIETYKSIRTVNGDIKKYTIDQIENLDDILLVSVSSEYERGYPVTDTFTLKETDSGYLFSEIDMPSVGVIEELAAAFYDAFSRRDSKAIYNLHFPGALSISEEEYAAYFDTFFVRFGKLENQIGHEMYPNIFRGDPIHPTVWVEYYTFAEGNKEIEMEIMYCVSEGEIGIGTVAIDDSKETKDY